MGMTDRTPESLARECEGLELLDDAIAHEHGSLAALQLAKREYASSIWRYRRAMLEYFTALLQTRILGLAHRISPRVSGIPLWPLAVAFVLVWGLLNALFASVLPFQPGIYAALSAILIFATAMTGISALLFFIAVAYQARKGHVALASQIDTANSRLVDAREAVAMSLGLLQTARINRSLAKSIHRSSKHEGRLQNRNSRDTTKPSLPFDTSYWRSLTGEEWEEWLTAVFEYHGYGVEATKTTGDQGVDLIVKYGTIRIAVQAKGYAGAVGNAAVQEVVAGKSFYDCSRMAVITNSTFTKAARELAACNDCILIGEAEIERLVRKGLKGIIDR